MKKLLLAAATVGLCACNFPAETKMEAVGEKQMESQKKQPNGEATSTTNEAAAQSASATR